MKDKERPLLILHSVALGILILSCSPTFSGAEGSSDFRIYPIPVGIENSEDPSNPVPTFIATSLSIKVKVEEIGGNLPENLLDPSNSIPGRAARLVQSLVMNEEEEFHSRSSIAKSSTVEAGSKTTMFAGLRSAFEGVPQESIRFLKAYTIGDLSFVLIRPDFPGPTRTRTLCFPFRNTPDQGSFDPGVFQNPFAGIINRLTIEEGSNPEPFIGKNDSVMDNDFSVSVESVFGESNPPGDVTVGFDGGFPGERGIIFRRDEFLPMTPSANEDRFGPLVEFYRETWRRFDAIPEVPGYLASNQMEDFLSCFAPQSAQKMRGLFAKIGDNITDLRSFKRTNTYGRRIRFIIDADPVKIVCYQLVDKPDYDHLFYNMVLAKDGIFHIINYRNYSVVDFLLTWDPFEAKLLEIINSE